jgi:ketosteroid isomerase-like protein
MSEAEELIRSVWARWNAGERELDSATFDPEIEIRSALSAQTYAGEDGARRWIEEIDAQFSNWELGIERIDELEDGRFVVAGAISARGRQSGLDLEQPASWIVEVRDGRIRGLQNFIGREAAAEAIGEGGR